MFTGTQDDDREAASMEPTVYFGQCGWDGYTWGERSRMYFRFSDSGRYASHRISLRTIASQVNRRCNYCSTMYCSHAENSGGSMRTSRTIAL